MIPILTTYTYNKNKLAFYGENQNISEHLALENVKNTKLIYK